MLLKALSFCTLLALTSGVCKSGALSSAELAVLDKHNELRGLHEDTADLCYGESGDDVTFTAGTWAQAMANAKTMQHSDGTYGENLAMAGTTGTVAGQTEAYTSSTTAWYDEIKDWSFASSASTGGVTGHFTAVVWKNTKQVNCGYATFVDGSFNKYYVVCQYYPPGNYVGEYAAQVAPLKDGGSSARFNVPAVTLLVLSLAYMML